MDMTQALEAAAKNFGATVTGEPIIGLNNKSIGSKVRAATGEDRWLKVVKVRPRLIAGPTPTLGSLYGQPATFANATIKLGGEEFLAELIEFVDAPPVSSSPILSSDIELPDSWFKQLREILERLAKTPVPRTSLHVPGTQTVTMHGDLHWSNLTKAPIHIFDWENCGQGPLGYDPAMLVCLALLNQKVTTQLETIFSDWLQIDGGLRAQTYAHKEIMSRYAHDPDMAKLKPLLEMRHNKILNALSQH